MTNLEPHSASVSESEGDALLSEKARVVALEDDAVWLETIRQSSCGACQLQKGCGQSALQNLFSAKRHHMRLSTQQLNFSLALNDQVEIGIPKAAVLQGSIALYLVPLLALIAGMTLASSLFSNEGAVLLTGFSSMAIAFYAIHEITQRASIHRHISPHIIRVIPSAGVVESSVSAETVTLV